MEWVLVAMLAAGGGGVAVRRMVHARRGRHEERVNLEAIRRLADEDVTVFGEQLQRLDAQVGDHPLDAEGRADYQTALDAYEAAQRTVPRLRRADDVSQVTETLGAGRYALACVQARVEGRPQPVMRTPCFFNPQHGPATQQVLWNAPRGGGTRSVPACAQDAARLARHEQPEVRTVVIGSRTVPYWQAGAAFTPYTEGYFAAAPGLAWSFAGYDPGGPWGDVGGYGGFGGPDLGGGGGGDFGGGDGGGN